jgi:hypothetical protein
VSGLYPLTLAATDTASGWICLYSLLNKVRYRAFDAIRDIRADLPFPTREFPSDNGGGFINQGITDRHLLEPEALLSKIKVEPARLRGVYNPVRLQHDVNKAVFASREAVAARFPSSGREPAA